MAVPLQTKTLSRAIVKQVLSGESVTLREQPRGGPPPERNVGLTNIQAPKLARRPNIAGPEVESKDEPWAWEAREFLRKKLVGKEITFSRERTSPQGKDYGIIYIGSDPSAENVTESLVEEGLVEVKRLGLKAQDEDEQRLVQLEDAAKAAAKGRWGPIEESNAHVRNIKWTIEQPRNFVDSHHMKPIDAVIEHVRDGCTVRAFLLPTFEYVTVMLSGIKCPLFKLDSDGSNLVEPYAEEAKFFTEARLLQRDVKIILEGVSNQNLLGTVLHPNGNIAEFLLKEGYARCVDWSMGVVSQGADKLRAAEKIAKEKKLRIWKDYQASAPGIEIKDKEFSGKVVEVINGDGLQVKLANGVVKKIFLASIRPPRQTDFPNIEDQKKSKAGRPRLLYDIPYMFDAREFLRKKLIGKKVNVIVDYIQPENNEYPEKTCCTVTISNINVAEALVSKGLASVVRYRQDDDQRSGQYDMLLAAEARAQKKAVGIHSKKEPSMLRVADVAGDVSKAKQFFPFLQRAGRCDALVEFVASGSRLRLYIPRETCLITFLLSGIQCPRGSRPDPTKPGSMIPAEPYGDEAAQFTRELCLQHEVEMEVEAMDKGGNFIGWMFVDGKNVSLSLVEQGLSKVHFTAERSSYYGVLCRAEEEAKKNGLKIWKDFVEPVEEVVVAENEPTERKITYKNVVITEVENDLKFFAQDCETGPQLDKLMEQLRLDMKSSPPLPGAYTPKKGDLCACKFVDGEWYRVKIEKVTGKKVHVLYVDFGNREITDTSKVVTLPGTYHALPAVAREYSLACCTLPPDEDQIAEAVDALRHDVLNKQCLLNTEYKRENAEFVTMVFSDNKEDVAQGLISEGLIMVEPRKEKRLAKLVGQYTKAQEKAKASRLNLWRYGDFREDDAKEFGYKG